MEIDWGDDLLRLQAIDTDERRLGRIATMLGQVRFEEFDALSRAGAEAMPTPTASGSQPVVYRQKAER